jgi:K+-sensing histidine kinase KdpD
MNQTFPHFAEALGEPRYWQGLSFNITDRTMAELEATRRLAALDELRNSMLTAISHELRTPPASILGASVTLECAGVRSRSERLEVSQTSA